MVILTLRQCKAVSQQSKIIICSHSLDYSVPHCGCGPRQNHVVQVLILVRYLTNRLEINDDIYPDKTSLYGLKPRFVLVTFFAGIHVHYTGISLWV